MARGVYNHTPVSITRTRGGRGVYVGVSFGDVAGVLAGPILGHKIASAIGGHELSDEEIRKSMAAAVQAVAPLVEAHGKMMRDWSPATPLSREQMTTIMQNALIPARETEKDLASMVDKVPAQWESTVRSEGGLTSLHQAIDEAPGFEALIAANTKDGKPAVVPGFRAWIDHLLSRTEDGVTAIAYVSDVLPDWLRMRDILSALHRAAVGVIDAVIAIASAVAKVVEDPGKFLKYGAIGLAAVLGVVIVTRSGR